MTEGEFIFYGLVSFFGVIILIIIIGIVVDTFKEKKRCEHLKVKDTEMYGVWPIGRGIVTYQICEDCGDYIRLPNGDVRIISFIPEFRKFKVLDGGKK